MERAPSGDRSLELGLPAGHGPAKLGYLSWYFTSARSEQRPVQVEGN